MYSLSIPHYHRAKATGPRDHRQTKAYSFNYKPRQTSQVFCYNGTKLANIVSGFRRQKMGQ